MLRSAMVVVLVALLVRVPAPAPRTVVVMVPTPPLPVVITVPAPAPADVPAPPTPPPPTPRPRPAVEDPDDLGPCPADFTRASDVAIAPPAGVELDRVTASAHDVRRLAAWNDEAVYVSVDEGRHFQRVLDHEGVVADAVFDCHGRLHVLRGDGALGTRDDGATPAEQWTQVATFATDQRGRLIEDGTGVAVIGQDVARPDRLQLVRRDARGSWRAAPLAHDSSYESWDGIEIRAIAPLPGARFRMLALPWQGGDCGYSHYLEVTFDLALRRVRVVDLGEELPPGHEIGERDGFADARVRDAAGRWIAVADYSDAEPQLVRTDD